MELKFTIRESFTICGCFVETCLEDCSKDIGKLWSTFNANKTELEDAYGSENGIYGLMWYTDNHRYCYMVGIEASRADRTPTGTTCKCIPRAEYAIACVPQSVPAVEAWTECFDKALPGVGYAPDASHGLYFEYYPEGTDGNYELWTPVVKAEL